MAMYTAAQIKDALNKSGDCSGFAFDKFGPYFANSERLKSMKNAFKTMLDNDAVRDKKRITDRSKKSINEWFSFLANRYGI